MRIDLNADLGEGAGDDGALLAIVTSANVATGAHAGGGALLRATVAAAVERGVRIGAHPSYRDRSGFGRVSQASRVRADPEAGRALVADLVRQILTVGAAAERRGEPLAHVKAHGALYNDAVIDPVVADLVVAAVRAAARRCGYPLALLTQPGGQLAVRAQAAGVGVCTEGFIDRAYGSDGRLIPRSRVGAVHAAQERMVDQALELASGVVTAVDGRTVDMPVGTMCVHGDTPGAVVAAEAVRSALEAAGHPVEAADLPEIALEAVGSRLRVQVRLADRGQPEYVHPFGDRAVLIEPQEISGGGTAWVLRTTRAVQRVWPAAVVRPGLNSVLVQSDVGQIDRAAHDDPAASGIAPSRTFGVVRTAPGRIDSARRRWLSAQLMVLALDEAETDESDGPLRGEQVRHSRAESASGVGPHLADATAPAADVHVLATHYDGPDLSAVAAAAGVPVDELVARHVRATWTVAAVGFAPGFGYLTCPDPLFADLPRRADPRTSVEPGSVALAAGMCAVYPQASPGGWHLVGRTAHVLFDPTARRPAVLGVGDQVRFSVAR